MSNWILFWILVAGAVATAVMLDPGDVRTLEEIAVSLPPMGPR